jgi:hypothetical protein
VRYDAKKASHSGRAHQHLGLARPSKSDSFLTVEA